MKHRFFCLCRALALAFAAPAYAGVDEMRFGYGANIRDDHGDFVEGKEGDIAELELVFSSPDFLN